MRGGPSHIDMWDTKPNAPAEYRGEFGTISTNVPGIQLSDMLPMCAQRMDKWSIIRSLHHGNAGHSAGDQICFTGYPPGSDPSDNVKPSCGSIVAEQLGHLRPELPAYVMIPRMVPGTDAAYLGASYKPFETQADPANPGPFKLPNFELAQGLSVDRLGDRRNLWKASIASAASSMPADRCRRSTNSGRRPGRFSAARRRRRHSTSTASRPRCASATAYAAV